ncbi:hypothetical protein ABZP36_023778 [Zizania latifolia]
MAGREKLRHQTALRIERRKRSRLERDTKLRAAAARSIGFDSMERNHCNGGGGVKVTFIETQFVTSDAAGFKSLVQRLTGNDAAPLPPLQRPRPCRADGTRGEGYRCHAGAASASASAGAAGRRPAVPPPAPACVEEMFYGTCDLAEMFCVDVATSARADGATAISPVDRRPRPR